MDLHNECDDTCARCRDGAKAYPGRDYVLCIGTRELHVYGKDDRRAKRIAARWIRLFWERFKAHIHAKYPGSMSDATNNHWYGEPPWCCVLRLPQVDSAGIYPCADPVLVDKFELTREPIAEFLCVYSGW